MKNKLLLCACVVAFMSAAFTSCKEQVNLEAITDGVAVQTLQGFFSGASQYGKELKVTEYNFLEDGSVEFTAMSFGDGIYKAPSKVKYSSWKFGEYTENNVGRNIILQPADGGAAKTVNFNRASIVEEGSPIMDGKNDKIEDLASTNESVLGKKWYGNDTTFYKIDTVVNIMKFDSIFRRTGYKKDSAGNIMYDENGQPIYERELVRVDTSEVPTKVKWPIGPKTIDIRRLELYRDSVTLENTGKWYMLSKAYSMDDKRNFKLTFDSTSSYDFHWNYISYTSTAAFDVQAVEDGTNNAEVFEIKYDFKLPSITLYKQVLKIEK